jgi:hypothetical protein
MHHSNALRRETITIRDSNVYNVYCIFGAPNLIPVLYDTVRC